MSGEAEAAISRLFDELLSKESDRTSAAQALHTRLIALDALSKATVHRYQCRRGCQLAVVFRAGSSTFCAVRDYKMSPGLNSRESVASARAKNTLDGDRWWPAHVYDVDELAKWGPGTGMTLTCRHYRGLLEGGAVLAVTEGRKPGHPGKPTRL